MLFTALELGVFDAIAAEGKATLEAVMKRVGIQAPRVKTLLTSLTASGLLHQSGGLYTMPKPVERFMVRSSKDFYGDYLRVQVGRQFYPKMGNLLKAMHGEVEDYTSWFSDPETAKQYTEAQHNGSLATGKALAKQLGPLEAEQLLDVGGGSGAFSQALCHANPKLKATV